MNILNNQKKKDYYVHMKLQENSMVTLMYQACVLVIKLKANFSV